MAGTFKLRWGFFTRGLAFDGSPIEEKSLGGSESALYEMARQLAKRGHSVQVICTCPNPGVYDGVEYIDAGGDQVQHMLALREWDVFVAHRFYDVLPRVHRAKSKWLWMHDMPVDVTDMCASLYDTDQVVALSKFHQAAYVEKEPALEKLVWLSKNGVDLELVKKHAAGVEHQRLNFAYISRPERGLGRLLTEIWPRLHAANPQRKLAVCSYDVRGWHLPEGLKEHYAELNRLIKETPGVVPCGNLSKGQLYKMLAGVGMLLYPTQFPEISCIAALESMACGTPVVTTDGFALSETVPYAREHGVAAPERADYADRFVAKVEEIAGNDLLWKSLQKQGKSWIYDHYRWATIAEQWEQRAYDVFRKRVTITDGKFFKVIDQLVYESDLVAARETLERIGMSGISLGHEGVDRHEWLTQILGTHHEDPDAYSAGAGIQVNEAWQENPRWQAIASMIPPGAKRALDVGCGAGGLVATIRKLRPEIDVVHGVDFSPALVARANAFLAETFPGDASVGVRCADAETLTGDLYDVVISSEVIEHQVDVDKFLASLEKQCAPGGTIILTAPSGPWEAISFGKRLAETRNDWEKNRFHVRHFSERDLSELLGQKDEFAVDFSSAGFTPRGEEVGWWFVRYRNTGKPTGQIDYQRKFLTTRPYQKLAYCMIVKNEQDNLGRNLRSIMQVVDEIHIADTGSTDGTKDVVRALQAEQRYSPKIFLHEPTWEEIRPVPNVTKGALPFEKGYDDYIEAKRLIAFDRARNYSTADAIERGADWILWADADEVFQGGMFLRKYLHTKISPSFLIRQNHMVVDQRQNPGVDMPFRLFKTGIGIKFWGVIHEQPSFTVNDMADPAHIIAEVDIVHFGYTDPQVVREKMSGRNLTLVMKDRCVYPERILGKLNVMRDELHLAQFDYEKTGGSLTERAIQHLRGACGIFHETFADGKSVYYQHALTFYQRCLALLATNGVPLEGNMPPLEVRFALSVGLGGIPEDTRIPAPVKRWFGSREELEDFLLGESSKIFAKFGRPYDRSSQAASQAAAVRGEAVQPGAMGAAGGDSPGRGADADALRGAAQA